MTQVQTVIINQEGYRKLGEHFIKWAKTGRARQEGENEDLGWPRTLHQFMVDVEAVWRPEDGSDTGDSIQIPKRIKSIQFVQSNMETLLVRLPPADLVNATEATLSDPASNYELPPFYKEIVEGRMTDKEEIFQHRVGDYTIAHCK